LKDGFGRSQRGHVLRYHLNPESIAALASELDDLLVFSPEERVENIGVVRGKHLVMWTITHDMRGGVVLDARGLSELKAQGFPMQRLSE